MKRTSLIVGILGMVLLTACWRQGKEPVVVDVEEHENAEAKAMLQGIWTERGTDDVSFRAEGDSIYYPDETSQPTAFRIIGDSLELGKNRYLIVRQTENFFCFRNQAGDEVELVKSEQVDDTLAFIHRQPEMLNVTEVVKFDSVVNYNGKRYHWYIAVNPTRQRVTKMVYNNDGVGVENIYYDNIIHIGLFQGAQRLYSHNFNKQMYRNDVPQDFLEQAILGNMQFDHVDADGFHFNATICIPDGISCYMVETLVGFGGEVTMKLLEY
ncbi:MAG: DUF4738 domain-containing protein [Prevotella sp.]|nr:DUF4738 domain-containing protein [Prevotella sp.]